MVEAVLVGMLFLATVLMLILSPMFPGRIAGLLWMLIGAGQFGVSAMATAVQGGMVSAAILYVGYTVMLGTGLLMIRGSRQSVLGVCALSIWFGVIVLRFMEAGVVWSGLTACFLLTWTLVWHWRTERQSQ